MLIGAGRLDEAERLALEAIETVGEHESSSRATTTMSLGLVRAAQGRDEEAEALLARRSTRSRRPGFRGIEVWVLTRLEEFLRARGRDEEADALRRPLRELAPVAALGDAFASRIERIA